MPNIHHTAIENAENAAPVPNFGFVINDYWRARKIREANIRYWTHVLFEAEQEGDLTRVRSATDTLAEFVMQARADAEAKFEAAA